MNIGKIWNLPPLPRGSPAQESPRGPYLLEVKNMRADQVENQYQRDLEEAPKAFAKVFFAAAFGFAMVVALCGLAVLVFVK